MLFLPLTIATSSMPASLRCQIEYSILLISIKSSHLILFSTFIKKELINPALMIRELNIKTPSYNKEDKTLFRKKFSVSQNVFLMVLSKFAFEFTSSQSALGRAVFVVFV